MKNTSIPAGIQIAEKQYDTRIPQKDEKQK